MSHKKAIKTSGSFVSCLVFLGSLWGLVACGQPEKNSPLLFSQRAYVAKDSTEAILKFRGKIEFKAAANSSERAAKKKIMEQLDYLFGPLGEAKYPAVPQGDHKVTNIQLSTQNGLRVATYDYQGTIVVERGPRKKLTVILPINPDAIYEAGTVRKGGRVTHPCTDAHYDSEGDFWYFWNPENAGCPLKEGRDYLAIDAEIDREPNTKVTYPEYDRLVDASGNILIAVLMGMDDPENSRDPARSNDTNAANVRTIQASLKKKGYSSVKWSDEQIRAVVPHAQKALPYVEDFVLEAKRAKIVVRLFFGPTGIDEKSKAFHYFFKGALEKGAIMIYDGHSGLGGHLDLASIESTEGFRIQPKKDRYQIYFFNSCSSYTYYNKMFFDRKETAADPEGTKNLDIMTNGLATYFSVMHDTNMVVIDAVETWAMGKMPPSFQQIAKAIDSDNLFGVNGDEDNPKRWTAGK